nr:hypothetical protein HK105_000202 [Polyrhizophydium stewartii]
MPKVPQLPESAYPSLADVVCSTDLLLMFAVSWLANVQLYHWGVARFPALFATPKQKAWLLTLVSSSVIVLGAVSLFVEFLSMPAGSTINELPSLNSWVANTLSVFFVGYLFADISVGVADYTGQIGLVTGWIHHFGYLICVVNCVKYRIAGGFLCFASILEMPTIVLALGHINRAWRRDLLFGALFFTTRIVLHAYVVWHVYNTYESNFWMVTAAPYPIHVYWFANWVRQQLRQRRRVSAQSLPASAAAKSAPSVGMSSAVKPASEALQARTASSRT